MKPLRLLWVLGALPLVAFSASPLETAIAQYRANDLPGARTALEALTTAEPQNAEAQFYLGLIAQRQDRTDDAVRLLETATRLAPNAATHFMELGGAYGRAAEKAGLMSKLSWAKKCQGALEKAVQLAPDNIVARNALVSFYRAAPSFAGGGISKAYEQAEEIRKRDPIAGAAVLGQLYLVEKKVDQAFALYDEALKTAPDNYAILYGIGRAAAQTGQHLDQGETALRRCLTLTPGEGEPGPAPVQWRLGNIAEKRGDPAAARTAYEAALQADPNFRQASEALAKLK